MEGEKGDIYLGEEIDNETTHDKIYWRWKLVNIVNSKAK